MNEETLHHLSAGWTGFVSLMQLLTNREIKLPPKELAVLEKMVKSMAEVVERQKAMS